MRTLTRKLAIIEPDMLIAGIDLAGEKNVAIVINQQARRLGRVTFSHSQAGYQHLRQELGRLCQRHGARQVMVGMEPTNHYWKLVAANLERDETPYRLVNAYTVKKHREGDQLDRAKDDQRDGFVIADLIRTGKFTETQRLTGIYEELRQCSGYYDRVRQDISRKKTQLRQAVGQTFPELGHVFKDLTGQTAWAMLQRHGSAHRIREMAWADFLAGVRADYQGCRLQRAKLHQAYHLAHESVGLRDTLLLEWSIQAILQTLELLQSQLAQVKEQLVNLFERVPAAPYLLSLGLGQVTTARIVAEIGNPAAYTSARQLVKLAGIQPSPNQSGQKSRSATPMSGKGRARLRTALYFAGLRLIQTDEAFAAYYHHLQHRPHNPLTPVQAIGVLMRKMLHILWSLWRTRSPYNPAAWRAATGL